MLSAAKAGKRKALDGDNDVGDEPSKKRQHQETAESVGLFDDDMARSEDASADGLLMTLLTQAGAFTRTAGRAFQLSSDPSEFRRRLRARILGHKRYPAILEEIFEGIGQLFDDDALFVKALSPVVTGDGDDRASALQDSLVRLLLGIDELQTGVVNMLLEKLPEYMMDAENNDADSMPRLIVGQLRWLDNVVDGGKLASKLMELVAISPLSVQREIVSAVPEIVDDSAHDTVAEALRAMMFGMRGLTAAILDSLSNLSINPDLRERIRGSVLDAITSADANDMPVIVRFLLLSAGKDEAASAIDRLRRCLDLNTLTVASVGPDGAGGLVSVLASQRASQRGVGKGPRAEASAESLTLDVLKSAIRFQRPVTDAWVRALQNCTPDKPLVVLDFFALLYLHEMTSHKKTSESVARKRCADGTLDKKLLALAIKDHASSLREHFPALLSLAASLLRCGERSATDLAAEMYKQSFKAFETYHRQEVVGALVTHVGSGSASEIDTALSVLCDLATDMPKEMCPFAVFVRGVLDYLDNLDLGQVRRLFSVLTILAARSQDAASGEFALTDDAHIVIRKQLSNSAVRYRRIGIVAAVAVVKHAILAAADAPHLLAATAQQCAALVELARNSCRTPECLALLYDELADAIFEPLSRGGSADKPVSGMPGELVGWIRENIASAFESEFLADRNGAPSRVLGCECEESGNLDGDETPILVSIFPFAAPSLGADGLSLVLPNGTKASRAGDKLQPLHPLFRLLQACEKSLNGSLENVDALLGGPLLMPETASVIDNFAQQTAVVREATCASLLCATNWYREIVNAYSSDPSEDMVKKVISRIQAIVDADRALATAVASTPSFRPYTAQFDGNADSLATAPAAANGKTKGAKSSSKGKGKAPADRKGKAPAAKDASDEDQDEEDPLPDKPAKPVGAAVSRDCFRELDFEVFGLLVHSLRVPLADSEETSVALLPSHLRFLLADLSSKLSKGLSSPKKASPFGRAKKGDAGFARLLRTPPRTLAARATQLVPPICGHLETIYNAFKTMSDDSDSQITDADAVEHMAESCELGLLCIHAVLSWDGISKASNARILSRLLASIAGRVAENMTSQAAPQRTAADAFDYMHRFADAVPSLAGCVALVRCLVAIASHAPARSGLHERVSSLCGALIGRTWEASSGKNDHIAFLLRSHIALAKDPVAVIGKFTGQVLPSLKEKDGRAFDCETHPSLTAASLPSYYRVLLEECVVALKASDAVGDRMAHILACATAFHTLVNLVKTFDRKPMLAATLRCGRTFIEAFIRHAMPVLDATFRAAKDDGLQILKAIQTATRLLQSLCGHSKVMQDVSLTSHVPPLKKGLETVIFRVKAMLELHGLREAFWLGNLKHRDIQGREVPSQVVESEAESDGGEGDATGDSDGSSEGEESEEAEDED